MLCLEGWAREGLTDKQIAESKIGINEATFCRWKNDFPQMVQALKRGKAPVDIKVENALLKRALGYDYEEYSEEAEEIPTGKYDEKGKPIVKIKKHIKRTKKFIPPDTTAAIFWLKNRKPATWRDKPEPPVSNEVMDRLDEVLDSIKGVV